MCGHKCLISEFLTFNMWSGNVVFGWHGNMCYVFFYWRDFYMIYIAQVKSMCVPIFRSIGSELTKLENMQQLYVLFDVTWRKNGTSYVMGTTTLLIGISTRNLFKPIRFKSYGWNSGFRVFGDLDLDLWPIFYFLSHALRMVYWNIHAKFHENPSRKTPYAL